MSNLSVSVLGSETKKIELPAEIFGLEPNVALIHQVVVAQRAAARQGTHATKTRGMVAGTRSKPWRQKGTGRARHGDLIAPQFVGGGIAHGPQPRSYAQRTPKKMIRAALLGALSNRVAENLVLVTDKLVSTTEPNTKEAKSTLAKAGVFNRVLVVLDNTDDLSYRSVRNLAGVEVLNWDQLSAYDVLLADVIIFTTDALTGFIANKLKIAKADVSLSVTETEPAKTDDAKSKKPKTSKISQTKSDTKAEAKTSAKAEDKPEAKKADKKTSKTSVASEENSDE